MNFRNWLYVSGPPLDLVNDLDREKADSYNNRFRLAVSKGRIPAVYIKYRVDGKTSYALYEVAGYGLKRSQRLLTAGLLEQHPSLSTVLEFILLQTIFT